MRKILFENCYRSCPQNLTILDEIIKKRSEFAKLLGFNTFAEYTVIDNMLNTPSKIMTFLKETYELLIPRANYELNELKKIAKIFGDNNHNNNNNNIQAWDIGYYSSLYYGSKFNLDSGVYIILYFIILIVFR